MKNTIKIFQVINEFFETTSFEKRTDIPEFFIFKFDKLPKDKEKENMFSNHMPERMVNTMMELNYITKQGWTDSNSNDFKKITGKESIDVNSFSENNIKAFTQ